MAMNPVILATAISAQIIAELTAHGWGIPGTPPVEGTQAGNTAIAPSQNILEMADAIGKAVADQVIIHIVALAEGFGVDSRGDSNVVASPTAIKIV